MSAGGDRRRRRPLPGRGARGHRLRRRAHPRLPRAPAAGRRGLHRRRRGRARLALDAAGGGRGLCAGRPGGLSLDGADERRAGPRRRASTASPWSPRPAGWSRRCWPPPRPPGSREIWRVGGAQAVAALAYGAGPIRPGRQDRRPRQRLCHRGQAAASTASSASTPWPARPRSWWSPTANDPDWIAADLLSQAEHDPAAQSILITDDAAFAAAVVAGGRAPAGHPGHRRGRRGRPGATTAR